MMTNEFNMVSHNGYLIVFGTAVKQGVWFQNPVYKQYYDLYGFDPFDESYNIPNVDNLGFMHKLLNGKERIKKLQDFVSKDNAAGFRLRQLRSPFYFKREERELRIFSPDEKLILHSMGYNYVDEHVGGACEREYTTIYSLISGAFLKRWRSDNNGGYNMTYETKAIEFINSIESRG